MILNSFSLNDVSKLKKDDTFMWYGLPALVIDDENSKI